MLLKIPGNVPENSGECSRKFGGILLVFLSNFAVKLLRDNGKNNY